MIESKEKTENGIIPLRVDNGKSLNLTAWENSWLDYMKSKDQARFMRKRSGVVAPANLTLDEMIRSDFIGEEELVEVVRNLSAGGIKSPRVKKEEESGPLKTPKPPSLTPSKVSQKLDLSDVSDARLVLDIIRENMLPTEREAFDRYVVFMRNSEEVETDKERKKRWKIWIVAEKSIKAADDKEDILSSVTPGDLFGLYTVVIRKYKVTEQGPKVIQLQKQLNTMKKCEDESYEIFYARFVKCLREHATHGLTIDADALMTTVVNSLRTDKTFSTLVLQKKDKYPNDGRKVLDELLEDTKRFDLEKRRHFSVPARRATRIKKAGTTAGQKGVCAFYQTEKGCLKGDNCDWKHIDPNDNQKSICDLCGDEHDTKDCEHYKNAKANANKKEVKKTVTDLSDAEKVKMKKYERIEKAVRMKKEKLLNGQ